ncbi:MAG: hypothetical protein HPY53_07815 [Brevinematales bacterium]|nr:hypothetical protein [Brevinematales bacterium]
MSQTCPVCEKECTIETIQLGEPEIIKITCPVCGVFRTYINIARYLRETSKEKSWYLSGILRNASLQNSAGIFLQEQRQVNEFINNVPMKPDPIEKQEDILLYIYQNVNSAEQRIKFYTQNDYSIFFLTSFSEFTFLLLNLQDSGYIDFLHSENLSQCRLTIKGWEKINELKYRINKSRDVFVAMWFCSEDNGNYKSLSDAYNIGICGSLETTGYKPIRVDQEHYNDKIDDFIIASIKKCLFIIADVTGQRQGVYFEAGYAKGLGKEVIFTVREDEINNCHFDTNHYNHIVWKNAEDLREKLINRIEATIL